MSKLPEKFPEYLIMYKTLTKKISDLDSETDQAKIEKYEAERTRIKNMFPDNFFDNYLE